MSMADRLWELLREKSSGEEMAAILYDLLSDDEREMVLRAKLAEALKEVSSLHLEHQLSPMEAEAARVVLAEATLLTAQTVADRVSANFRTLRHRSAASSVLNELVTKGVLGKVESGRGVYFASPEEAVTQALTIRGELPTECSPDEIAAITGMPLGKVLVVLRRLVDG
jgi:hypothetical protein